VKKLVIIIDSGMIEDVLSSSKEQVEIMIVDFDKKTLNQLVLEELKPPHPFHDVAALADIYAWDAVYDPKRVKEIFAEKKPDSLLNEPEV
jgi:hypothetical protein